MRWLWTGLMLWVMTAGPVWAQELDFRQRYERGKLLLQRKMYADAINELKKASYTTQGRSFFGVYYYLAYAYYWLPDIRQANLALQSAKRYASRATHREALKKMYTRIQRLYSKVTIVPEVDPDEVGRLRLKLKPKIVFGSQHKQRYLRILNKRLKANGVVPNNRPFYVPKGDYEIVIAEPQCLRYTLIVGGQNASDVSIGDGITQFTLKAGQSCTCTGGQKQYGQGRKMYCACPPGTGWNKDKQRCEVGVNPVPWIAAGVGILVAGAAAVVIGLVVAQNDGTDYRLLQNPNGSGGKTKIWQ